MHEGDSANGGPGPAPVEPTDTSLSSSDAQSPGEPPPSGEPPSPGEPPLSGEPAPSGDLPSSGNLLPSGSSPRRRYRLAAPRWAHALLVYLVVIVLAAAAGVGVTLAVRHPGLAAGGTSGQSDDAAASGFAAMNDETVYNAVEPGIVDVDANMQYLDETAEGTGFVINAADGLVLTNNHVIDDATSVTVTPVASGLTYRARVLGYDRADDVALLKLPDPAGLKAVPIGDSSHVTVGTPVLAIGNEAGQGGSPTVAPGVISGLDRTIKASDQTAGLMETLFGMLQTSANIRPGDSGGPLANAAGQVIGIDTAAGGSTVYSGYAIPIRLALSIANRIASGHVSPGIQIGLPGFLGALVPHSSSSSPRLQASQEQKQASGVGSGRFSCVTGETITVPAHIAPARSGALVNGVLCGTVAASAGLIAGDVITAIDGKPVTTPDALTAVLSRYPPGRGVSLAWVSPDGGVHTALLILDPGPAQ